MASMRSEHIGTQTIHQLIEHFRSVSRRRQMDVGEFAWSRPDVHHLWPAAAGRTHECDCGAERQVAVAVEAGALRGGFT